jgi:hypothetical protein
LGQAAQVVQDQPHRPVLLEQQAAFLRLVHIRTLMEEAEGALVLQQLHLQLQAAQGEVPAALDKAHALVLLTNITEVVSPPLPLEVDLVIATFTQITPAVAVVKENTALMVEMLSGVAVVVVEALL